MIRMNKNSLNKLVRMLGHSLQGRRAKLLWIGGASIAVTLTGLVSCGTLQHAIMAPPDIPGATFVGSETCATCHETITRDFKTADHARLKADGKNAEHAGCEGCHGPGSLHVNSGGSTKLIVNPKKDPEACFKCHLDIRSKFSLPYRHAVMEGRMSCADCHDPHKGSARKGGSTLTLMGKNEVCFQCHTLQRGPFVYQHEATREGCTTCHDPHGSVNQKLLVARNAMLCLKCHFQVQRSASGGAPSPGQVSIGDSNHGTGRLAEGTCWSAGCHEAIHGSNVNQHFRY